MTNKKLTEKDFASIAERSGLEKAVIKAIFKVEAGGRSGFIDSENSIPVTLQEGHIFYKYAKERGLDVAELCKKYPQICYPKWTKEFYKRGQAEYNRYLLASEVDSECAMLSTSWGLGQIMGFNYYQAGYTNISAFVGDIYVSEQLQLKAMCTFIMNNKIMYNALRNHDWATFAKLYNGTGYAANAYDVKLKKAYESARL